MIGGIPVHAPRSSMRAPGGLLQHQVLTPGRVEEGDEQTNDIHEKAGGDRRPGPLHTDGDSCLIVLGYVRDVCLCRIGHNSVYAASLIILSNCRNSVVSLTFCSLLRGIIRSHGKGKDQAKALQ